MISQNTQQISDHSWLDLLIYFSFNSERRTRIDFQQPGFHGFVDQNIKSKQLETSILTFTQLRLTWEYDLRSLTS